MRKINLDDTAQLQTTLIRLATVITDAGIMTLEISAKKERIFFDVSKAGLIEPRILALFNDTIQELEDKVKSIK